MYERVEWSFTRNGQNEIRCAMGGCGKGLQEKIYNRQLFSGKLNLLRAVKESFQDLQINVLLTIRPERILQCDILSPHVSHSLSYGGPFLLMHHGKRLSSEVRMAECKEVVLVITSLQAVK